jgi:hypothetical protein
LAVCNGRKTSNGAASSLALLATMKAQQAVAKRFVGRRVSLWTCLFFVSGTAHCAFTSLRDLSLQGGVRNAAATSASASD